MIVKIKDDGDLLNVRILVFIVCMIQNFIKKQEMKFCDTNDLGDIFDMLWTLSEKQENEPLRAAKVLYEVVICVLLEQTREVLSPDERIQDFRPQGVDSLGLSRETFDLVKEEWRVISKIHREMISAAKHGDDGRKFFVDDLVGRKQLSSASNSLHRACGCIDRLHEIYDTFAKIVGRKLDKRDKHYEHYVGLVPGLRIGKVDTAFEGRFGFGRTTSSVVRRQASTRARTEELGRFSVKASEAPVEFEFPVCLGVSASSWGSSGSTDDDEPTTPRLVQMGPLK